MNDKLTNRLIELRKEKNLSQKQIADILNIKPNTYNHYERNKRNIDIDSLIILADYYKVSLDYITGRF